MSETVSPILSARRASHLRAAPLRIVKQPDARADEIPDAPPPPVDAAWLPAENVLLLAVPMPTMSSSQRRASVAFAVEEFIAQPLDDVHVVLGPEISKGIWLVAVVSNAVMQSHRLDHDKSLRLLPDTLALPVPDTGWSIWAGPTRALVRAADGTGFATSCQNLAAFWKAAGSPSITLVGGVLPEGLTATAKAPLPSAPDKSMAGFSLLSGRHMQKGHAIPRGLIPVAALLVIAVLGHLSLQIVDTLALSRIATEREDALRSMLSVPPGTNIDTAVAQALAARQPQQTGGFLPLMTEIFAAMATEMGSVTLRDLRYGATQGSAIMTIEAPDLATLQALETAFGEAGLRVSAGAATTGNGGATVQMTVQPGTVQ